jgi:hypothetical protein
VNVEASIRRGLEFEMAGSLADAEGEYRAVLDAVRGSGSEPEREVTINLARLCANDGREFEALALAIRARDASVLAGDAWQAALAQLQVANALDGIADYERIPPILDRVEAVLSILDRSRAERLRLSVALHRARLVANLGDVEDALVRLQRVEEASLAVNGKPVPPRIVWFVNVVALIAANRCEEAEPWLDRIPPTEGIVRRELEYAEQRARCLLVLRPDPDGIEAASTFLSALQTAPGGTVGVAWRLRAATDLATRLVSALGPSDITRVAWDLAGHATLTRVAQVEHFMRTLPEVAGVSDEVHDLLTEYRSRFRNRHEQLLREVGAARPWPPVDRFSRRRRA